MDNKHLSFLWGAATSSHQVEGGNALNDWSEWESLGRVRDKSGQACDHYKRFRDDFKMAQGLGHTAHRFSLEWSRLEPEEGRWDATAWEHYGEVIRTLKSLGMEPMVTLNHFTLPLWLYKKGGWLCEDSQACFGRFAKKAAEMFAGDVRYWLTVNEPLVYAYMAYVKGVWPPGKTDGALFQKVFEREIGAHVRAYRAIHAVSESRHLTEVRVGLAHNMARFFPCRERSLKDAFAALMRDRMYNHRCIRTAAAARSLDFIGLNYYTCDYVKYRGLRGVALFGEPCYDSHHDRSISWKNSLGWKVCPRGLYDLLKNFAAYGLPIIITENGICAKDDSDRSRFMKEHLDSVFRAAAEGIPVAGYLYWSLMDNFEWADGYAPRFGMVEVDYATQERRIRPSARFMSDYINTQLSVLSA